MFKILITQVQGPEFGSPVPEKMPDRCNSPSVMQARSESRDKDMVASQTGVSESSSINQTVCLVEEVKSHQGKLSMPTSGLSRHCTHENRHIGMHTKT